MNHPPRILVIGSLNVDHVFRTARLPRPGETVSAGSYAVGWGGKGANQAVAVARAGARTRFIGTVGADPWGVDYQERLESEGIDVCDVRAVTESPTGSAWIVVDEHGENSIVVHPGANAALSPQALRHSEAAFEWADGVLMPMESPLETVVEAMSLARRHGVRAFLNPSPWQDRLIAALPGVDTLILNRGEATAWERLGGASGCEFTGQWIVTDGGRPTGWGDSNGPQGSCPAFSVDPVDTVGAGDAFAGAYVVATLSGEPMLKSLRFANAFGALATLRCGAQSSIPTRAEALAFLGRHD